MRYYAGGENRCPSCDRMHWIIGRVTAECAFCGTTLALVDGCNSRDVQPEINRFGKGGGHVR